MARSCVFTLKDRQREKERNHLGEISDGEGGEELSGGTQHNYTGEERHKKALKINGVHRAHSWPPNNTLHTAALQKTLPPHEQPYIIPCSNVCGLRVYRSLYS